MDRINFLLTDNKNRSTSYAILAATDYTTANTRIASSGAKFSLFIQKILLAVTTDNAAVQTFQTNNGTPVEIAKSKASPVILLRLL